jgi:uncharacterized protein (DUF2164 family)
MALKNNRFQFASPEQKTQYVNDVIHYFHKERGEEIGVIAAESILDFLLETLGDEIYGKAIKDCQKLLKERCEDLDIELTSLNPKV